MQGIRKPDSQMLTILYQPAVMLTHPKARGVVRSTLTRDAPGPR